MVLKTASSFFLLLYVVLNGVPAAQAQGGQALTADLARHYFASPETEATRRADLNTALQRLQGYKGRLDSGAHLLGALMAYEEVEKVFRRHEGYLHLRCAQDVKYPACDARDRLESDTDAKTAFLSSEVLALPNKRMRAFFASEPRLKRYQFALNDMRREAGHILPEDKQALLDRFQPEILDWQYGLYQRILSGIPFGTVQTKDGPLDVMRQRNLLATNSDPKVREEAFHRRYSGFASQRDLIAFSLIHTVQAQNMEAQAHHYADAPTRKYASMSVDVTRTKALLTLMGQMGDITKRFEKIRASDFEKKYKTPMRAWDLSAPTVGETPPNTPLSELPRIFHEAFAGLGPEYQKAFDALLDPANGRADVIPGGAPNRYRGGFSIGFADSTSVLFFGRYDSAFKDLSVIAHEGGHAVHRSLMSSHGVAPLYADGPNFLFESFAAFNELVLADYMAKHSVEPALQRYFLEQWMSIKGLDALYGAQDALLEQQVYEGVTSGDIRSADDLDKLSETVDRQFSIFPDTTPELRSRWEAVSLMYEDPLYDVNYVYGGLLALKYYQLYSADPEDFVPRYTALLKNGFDAPPVTLLKRFLKIDLLDPSFVTDDFKLLDQRLTQLEKMQ